MYDSREDAYIVEFVFADKRMYASLNYLENSELHHYLEAINYANTRGIIDLSDHKSQSFINCVVENEVKNIEDIILADFLLIESFDISCDTILKNLKILTFINKFTPSFLGAFRWDDSVKLIAPETFGICGATSIDNVLKKVRCMSCPASAILVWLKGSISGFESHMDNIRYWTCFQAPKHVLSVFESKIEIPE